MVLDELGLELEEPLEALLQRARAAWAPQELTVEDLRKAPPEIPRTIRGAFDSSGPTVYLNPGVPNLDTHTLAHELGHAILKGEGWIQIGSRAEIDDKIIAGWSGMFGNRLEHIAMEPILTGAGFDTAPGHKARINIDLATLDAELDRGVASDDPGLFLPRAVRLAESYFCAAPEDFTRVRAHLAERVPRAAALGSELIEIRRAVDLSALEGQRAVAIGWLKSISREIPSTGSSWAPRPIDWLVVSPVDPRPGDLDLPACRRITVVAGDVLAGPLGPATITRFVWNLDNSTCLLLRVPELQGTRSKEHQEYWRNTLAQPLRALAQQGLRLP